MTAFLRLQTYGCPSSPDRALIHPTSSRVRDHQRWRYAALLAYFAVACGGSPSVGDEDSSTGGKSSRSGHGRGGSSSQEIIVGSGGQGGSSNSGSEEPSICGNGTLESKELCDDGNTNNDDGCSSDCTAQDPSYTCSKPGQACVKWMDCGNGVIEGEEQCDDGNTSAGDGCSSNCRTVESGWGCARPGKPCFQLPACGNGIRERGEGCDDGQSTPASGDGCSQDCQTEEGYICVMPGQACVKDECGDGNRTPKEQCDDHNNTNGDGCSSTCQIESGYRCSAQGCSTICGDGAIEGAEKCDDGNLTTGDGCSAACLLEPFFDCSGTPSKCNSTISCGNSVREPGEICDPPNVNGCSADCKSFTATGPTAAVCGDGSIGPGETCDPPSVGHGCSLTCSAEPGFDCPRPGYCIPKPKCGDGRVNPGEGCDDGGTAPGDGCSPQCQPEASYTCFGLGPSRCIKEVCGDGKVTFSEQCDDGPANIKPGDGCTNCHVDAGWVCSTEDTACMPRCGDGVKVGNEACDDGNVKNEDGCSSTCRVELGFTCPTAGKLCQASVCGNGGSPESGEFCDDGNTVAGDGCGPTCQGEPKVTVGTDPKIAMVCGDGLITTGEICDDGNVAAGDGCAADCKKVEDGFTCDPVMKLPGSVQFEVTYRDFRSSNATAPGGHPDFQYNTLNAVPGIAGAVCTTSNSATCGRLDAQGKPVLAINNQSTTGIQSPATFGLWYRDSNPTNVPGGQNSPIDIDPFIKTLTLTQITPGLDGYGFDSNAFFPLAGNEGHLNIGAEVPTCNNGAGVTNFVNGCNTCDATCMSRNYGFTTELRYFFQYGGKETLTFKGDDDVWVFINGRLAVDIGGLHQQLYGRVVLGDDGSPSGNDSDCSLNESSNETALGNCYTTAEQNDNTDSRFGLTKGGVYEIVLFHAERHTSASNFRLTLSGFLAPRSYCKPTCGDGIPVAGEACDEGPDNKDNVSGACSKDCSLFAFCGDGKTQIGEQCDNGTNLDFYATGDKPCGPGCILPPKCGDGKTDISEECDLGSRNADGGYGPDTCTTKCKLGGYCGDGQKNGNEACDNGTQNGGYGPNSCNNDCTPGPYCGDGARNGAEECDEGPLGGATCDASCKVLPVCGDGLVSTSESCDWGKFWSTSYGGCTQSCQWGPRCGDGNVDSPIEDCDFGTSKNVGGYDNCSATCTYGPRCGDAVVQSDHDEQCDNGFNSDVYGYYPDACGPKCKRPPYCGDSQVAQGFELCDEGSNNSDTAYEGCTSKCEWGAYCGDGKVDTQAGEVCDKGLKNEVYGKDSSACGFDCRPAPFCGDGERNGPEQCDLGAEKNTGAYGTCNADCTMSPHCGDKIVQDREQCDDGPTGSLKCSPNCTRRGDPLL